MIKPHGSEELTPKIVNTDEEKESLLKAAESMKKLKVTSAAAANLVMLGAGYFTPLDGFMNKDDLEHVTLYIRKNLNNFKIQNVESSNEEFMPNLRLCIDYEEDFIFIKQLVDKLGIDSSIKNIINYLKENPELLKINNDKSQTRIDGSNW